MPDFMLKDRFLAKIMPKHNSMLDLVTLYRAVSRLPWVRESQNAPPLLREVFHFCVRNFVALALFKCGLKT